MRLFTGNFRAAGSAVAAAALCFASAAAPPRDGGAAAAAATAYDDGFYDVALEEAASVFVSAGGSADKGKAFDVMMAASEKTKKAEERVSELSSDLFMGRPWSSYEADGLDFLRRFWKARALSDAGRHDDAAAVLEQALDGKEPSVDLRLRAVRQLAYEYSMLGDSARAVSLMRGVLESGAAAGAGESERTLFNLDLGRLLVAAGDLGQANEFLEDLSDTDAVMSALMLSGSRNFMSAADNGLLFREYLDSNPGAPADIRSLVSSAYACVLANSTNADVQSEAIDMSSKAMSLAESSTARFDAVASHAYVLAKAGDSDGVRNAVKKILAAAPQSRAAVDTLDAVIAAFEADGDNSSVLEFCKMRLASFLENPEDAAVYMKAGRAASSLGSHSEAASLYIAASERMGGAGGMADLRDMALMNAAEEFSLAGDRDQAVLFLRKLRSETTNETVMADAHLREAENLSEYDPEVAEQEFESIVRGQAGTANGAKALFMCAVLAARAGDYTNAVERYSGVCAMDAASPGLKSSACLGRGMAEFRLDRYSDALRSFEESAVVPDGGAASQRAAFLRTEALFAMGRNSEAYSNAVAFLEGFPSSEWLPDAYFWLGRYDFNNGDYVSAEKRFSAFCESWPENASAPGAMLLSAYAQARQFKHSEAIASAETLVERYPGSAFVGEARFFHGEMLCELLQFDSAALVFGEIAEDRSAGLLGLRALGRRADCLYTLGADNPERYSEAVDCYEKVLERARGSGAPMYLSLQANYKIGKCLEKTGREEEACRRYYENVILAADLENSSGTLSPDDYHSSSVWYARAVLDAAALYSKSGIPGDVKKAESLLRRLAQSEFPGAAEAKRALGSISGGILKFSAGEEYPRWKNAGTLETE